jgi:tetratricopeptide (TPR) repeat protein
MSSRTLSAQQLRRLSLATALCFASPLGSSPVLASGGGSSQDRPSAPPAAGQQDSQDDTSRMDLTTCPRGQVWNTHRRRCVRMRSEALPDDEMATYAYALAKAHRYPEALQVLDVLKNPNTATALNYRGYATRKLGRTDEGIGYYLRSVALDPNYPQVREYLGEAYVIKGRLDLARDQLATIKTLCGTGCEPYRDLSTAIAAAPTPTPAL